MDWNTFPFLVPYLASLVLTGWLALLTYQRRQMAGARALAVLLVGEGIWTFGYIFELLSPGLEGKLWWDNIQFIGTYIMPPAFLVLALDYSALGGRRMRWGVALASLPLAATLLVILAAPTSALVRPAYALAPILPFNELTYDFSPLLWASYIYSYAFTLAALILMLRLLPRQRQFQRSQTLTIIFGLFIPILGTVFTLLGFTLSGQRDISPFTFALGNLIIAWGVLRYRLFNTAHLARDVVVENMGDPVITIDAEDRLVDLNPVAAALLGKPAAALLGTRAAAALPFWKDLLPANFDLKKTEAEVHLANGIICEVRLVPVLDKTGLLAGRVLILHDVTARRQAEGDLRRIRRDLEQRIIDRTVDLGQTIVNLEAEVAERRRAELALGDSEEKFRTIIEQSSESFVLVDEQGLVSEVNPAYERLFGLGRSQAIGRPFWEVILSASPADSNPVLQEWLQAGILEAVSSGQSILTGHPLEIMLHQANRPDRWILQSVFPIRTRSGFRLGAISRDITEIKLSDLAVRESEEKFRTFIEQSSDGFLLLDEQGLVIEANAACLRISGLERSQVVGSPLWEIPALAAGSLPENLEQFRQELQAALQSGNSPLFEQSLERELRPNDVLIYFLQTFFPIRTKRGFRIGSILSDITRQKQAQQRIQAELEKLNGLRLIDISITGGHDVEYNLNVILEQAALHLGLDAGRILLLNNDRQELSSIAWRGFNTIPPECPQVNDRSSLAWTAIRLGQQVHYSPEDPASLPQTACNCCGMEGFKFCLAAPLIVQGSPRGVLEVFMRRPFAPDQDWINYLDTLAGQAAVAVDNAYLVVDLQRTNLDLSEAYEATISGWSQALELRDKETKGHSERVTYLATELGRRMGITGDDLVNFRRGVLLHDIGKMGIPDSILLKPGPLTEDEWVVMRLHVQYARNLLVGIPYLRPAIDVALYHHEHWDGSGYPSGLKGAEIPLGARIFAVLDVWDALCSNRPYRPAWGRPEALRYIKQLSGRQFDPEVVQAFLDLIKE